MCCCRQRRQKVTKPEEEAGTPVQEAEIQEETIQKQLERQLVETLQQVEGVGAVTAAITLETTGRKIVEKDTPANDSMTSQEDSQGGKQDSKTAVQRKRLYIRRTVREIRRRMLFQRRRPRYGESSWWRREEMTR